MPATIQAISYHLPPYALSTQQLANEFPEWSVEKIDAKVGIKNRYITDADTFASDLAIAAAHKLFETHNISPQTIDFVLLCTQSPDYFLPTTACIIQHALGIPTQAGALDFNLGCSGYIYGLGLAKGLVDTQQATNVLLLTAETYSKFIHPQDKSVRTIFGDAAAATLISNSPVGSPQGSMQAFVYGTDGSGAANLIVPNGGMRHPAMHQAATLQPDGNYRSPDNLYMNGSEIFIFTLNSVPKLIQQTLQKAELTLEDIDLVILHQANSFMLETLRKKMNIPTEKFFIFIENCGNTVSSTIPIALCEAIAQGRAGQGSRILLAGFGVGYSWGGCVVVL
jgi:3-oxoacyl-[acyl-carrier-protein] synthase-3